MSSTITEGIEIVQFYYTEKLAIQLHVVCSYTYLCLFVCVLVCFLSLTIYVAMYVCIQSCTIPKKTIYMCKVNIAGYVSLWNVFMECVIYKNAG